MMNEQLVSGPLQEAHRQQLDRLVSDVGELATLKRLGVSRTSLYRALAKRPLYGSTRIAIETALDGKR